MTPDVTELLHESRDACLKIIELTQDLTHDDYLQNELHRFAVNWNVVVLGEALNVALGVDDELVDRLPSARRAIATRHRIAHGYRTIDDSLMWTIATKRIPELLTELDSVLFG